MDGGGDPSGAIRDPETIELGAVKGGSNGSADVICDRTDRECSRNIACIVPSRSVADDIELEIVSHHEAILVQLALLSFVRLTGAKNTDFGDRLG
jgi:hypothetical protein